MNIKKHFAFAILVSFLLLSLVVHADSNKCIDEKFRWYQYSAEKNAIYREIFYSAEQIIKGKVKKDLLKPYS